MDAKSRLSLVILAGFASLPVILILRNTLDLRVGDIEHSSLAAAGMGVTALAALVFFAALAASLVVLWQRTQLKPALKSATHITSMVFLILI
ncbi:MAG TPA: tripartite transporter, partial [Hyphomonas sp.]|nr:tripartite transporter [Hyphomonas sp.]